MKTRPLGSGYPSKRFWMSKINVSWSPNVNIFSRDFLMLWSLQSLSFHTQQLIAWQGNTVQNEMQRNGKSEARGVQETICRMQSIFSNPSTRCETHISHSHNLQPHFLSSNSMAALTFLARKNFKRFSRSWQPLSVHFAESSGKSRLPAFHPVL